MTSARLHTTRACCGRQHKSHHPSHDLTWPSTLVLLHGIFMSTGTMCWARSTEEAVGSSSQRRVLAAWSIARPQPSVVSLPGRRRHPVSPTQRPARALGRHLHQLRHQPRRCPQSLQNQGKQKPHKALAHQILATHYKCIVETCLSGGSEALSAAEEVARRCCLLFMVSAHLICFREASHTENVYGRVTE